MSKFNSIILKRYLHIQEEYAAAAAIIPGMLVELTSAGTVQKHSGAGKSAIPMFAIEDALQGKGINQNLGFIIVLHQNPLPVDIAVV